EGPRRRVVEVVEHQGLCLHHGRRRRRGEQHEQGRELPHPFTPPAISPAMYWRCSARNSASTGSTVTTDPAIISSLSCTCSRERLASATGSVCSASSVSTISGHMKSFQLPRKLKIASVASTGARS